MAVEVHVEGQVVHGRLADFTEGVRGYVEYARTHGYAVPRVLIGLSGVMNTVRLVYTYEDLGRYERDEVRTASDRDYAEAAMAMPFVEGSLRYSIFHVQEPER